MNKRAIIFDLDNTIYSVHAIGDTLFAPLFALIVDEGSHAKQMDIIKDEIMRRPFQLVAKAFQFSDDLVARATDLLNNLGYEGKIETYPDYPFAKELKVDKFLVTTGFTKLQYKKIDAMGITGDFKEIHVVDPGKSDSTKKDVFADLMHRHGYANSEVLVVGDDLQSEIKAAQELEMEAVLYDRDNSFAQIAGVNRIRNFSELVGFL